MTQNEKDILLKDLCARLPYGVKAEKYTIRMDGEFVPLIDVEIIIAEDIITLNGCPGYTIKPYLFPLSSMTAEQKEFIKNKFCYDWDIDDHPYSLWTYCIGIGDVDELIDWFHKNHIDYRGLIPMGLANDATGLNIY